MAIQPRKRQQQQERRAAKRKAKVRQLTRANSMGLAQRLAAADRFPILHCWVSTDLWHQGLGYVGLSRVLPGGLVAYAVFLIDRYCLGVKNALADITSRQTYESKVVHGFRARFETEDMDPSAARSLVEQAVAYAEGLGLHPHADYHKANRIFGSIDASACTEKFEFGKDGKPFFISGPNDTPERCRAIMAALQRHSGAGNYDFMMAVGGGSHMRLIDSPEEQLLEAGEFEDEDDEGEEESPSAS